MINLNATYFEKLFSARPITQSNYFFVNTEIVPMKWKTDLSSKQQVQYITLIRWVQPGRGLWISRLRH